MATTRQSRHRIFLAFLTYTLLSFGVATVCFWLFRRVESINILAHDVHQLHIDIRELSKIRGDFMLYEPYNEFFYRTKNSTYLKQYEVVKGRALTDLDRIEQSAKAEKWDMREDLQKLQHQIQTNDSLLGELAQKIIARGFKNEGKEGEFRRVAHQLEERAGLDEKITLLQLRRYEKDFINRLDSSAFEKWKMFYEQALQTSFKNDNESEKLVTDSLFKTYKAAFIDYTQTDYEIGFKKKQGLMYESYVQNDLMLSHIKKIDIHAQFRKETILSQLRFITIVIVTVSVITSMLLGLAFPYIMKT